MPVRSVYEEEETFYESAYPVGLFADVIEARKRGDFLFVEILAKKYREDPVLSGAIKEALKRKRE